MQLLLSCISWVNGNHTGGEYTIYTHTHSSDITDSYKCRHTRPNVQYERHEKNPTKTESDRKEEGKGETESGIYSVLLLVSSTGTESQWNVRSPPPPHSPPLTSNSTAAKHAAGCGGLTKLNNTCQESLTHNQLCNTGGSHYVSIFGLHWPRPVYYTTKTHPYFHLAKVLCLYIRRRHVPNKTVSDSCL